jgi:hypothetical protein
MYVLMIGPGQGFMVQRFPDVTGIQGIIRLLKSILEAFYGGSVGFVIPIGISRALRGVTVKWPPKGS